MLTKYANGIEIIYRIGHLLYLLSARWVNNPNSESILRVLIQENDRKPIPNIEPLYAFQYHGVTEYDYGMAKELALVGVSTALDSLGQDTTPRRRGLERLRKEVQAFEI